MHENRTFMAATLGLPLFPAARKDDIMAGLARHQQNACQLQFSAVLFAPLVHQLKVNSGHQVLAASLAPFACAAPSDGPFADSLCKPLPERESRLRLIRIFPGA